MHKISELLDDLKYNYTSEKKSFKGNNIEIYTTNKFVNNKNTKDNIVAKYLIINCLNIEFDLLFRNFNHFQNNLIADVFYSHRDDIRWNIYAFIIVEDKSKISKEGYSIETDEDYARKFIFEMEDLKDFLEYGFFGQVESLSKLKVKTNFILEWDNYLKSFDLNGCLYNKMSMESIEDYISSGKPIRPIGRPTKNEYKSVSKENSIIQKINELQFKNYRKHCFNREFNYSPGLVNLISGSNGSGKSSICDAIALGLSGTSRSDDLIKIKCENSKGDEILFLSKKTPEESRELDLTWYGTTTTGSKSRLVENFNIFNYLQASAIYNKNSMNLKQLLQNLIYGEETTQTWKNMQNYKENFNIVKRELKIKMQELKIEIKDIDETISNINLNNYVVNLKSDFNIDKSKIEKILNGMILVEDSVSKIDKKILELDGVETLEDLENKYNQVMIEYYTILVQKDEILKKEINYIELQKEMHSNLNQLDKLYKLKTEYEEINRKYNLISHEKISSIGNFEEFTSKYFDNETKCNKLKNILKEYDSLRYYEGKIDLSIDKRFKSMSLYYQYLLKKYEDLQKSSSIKQDNRKLTESILSDIAKLAKEYQNMHKENSKCPLCGSDFINSEAIEDAINTTALLNKSIDKELDSIFLNSQKLKRKIIAVKSKLEDLEIKSKKNKEISDFTNRLYETNITLYENTGVEIYKKCEKLVNYLEEFLYRNKEVINFIHEIENEDIYLEFKKQPSIEDFSLYLINRMEYTLFEIDKNIEKNKIIKEQLSVIEKKLEEKEVINNKIDGIKKKEALIKEICDSSEIIKDTFNKIDNKFNIKTFFTRFYSLKNLLEENLKRENDDLYRKSLQDVFDKKKKELEIAEKKIKRCEKAIKALSELDSLENNMSIFIKENSKRIERIFKMIHRPKEFTDLNIENDMINFVRETTKETVNISNISTGQALSLIFAVTLCLHFSAKNAPNILIFDEPVANLDDLHIMNLVDMLKELSLIGVQLFITTANDQVATYIRRKFSCFNEDFKHLDIQRKDERPSIFTEQVYSPYREEAIISRLIAI